MMIWISNTIISNTDLPVCHIIINLSSPPEAKNVPLHDQRTLLTQAIKMDIKCKIYILHFMCKIYILYKNIY